MHVPFDANGPDMGFDPAFPAILVDRLRVSTQFLNMLLRELVRRLQRVGGAEPWPRLPLRHTATC